MKNEADCAVVVEPIQELAIAKAKRLIRDGKDRVAEQGLLQLMHVGPPNKDIYNMLAVLCARQARFDEARTMWQKALEIDPDNQNYIDSLKLCETRKSRQPIHLRPWSLASFAIVILAIVAGGVFASVSPNSFFVSEAEKPASINQATKDVRVGQTKSSISAGEGVFSVASSGRGEILLANQNGILKITGTVPTAQVFYQICEAAKKIPGFEAVDVSSLSVVGTVRVKTGDSLWQIAEQLYMDPSYWKLLAEKNKLLPPYAINTGQQLLMP